MQGGERGGLDQLVHDRLNAGVGVGQGKDGGDDQAADCGGERADSDRPLEPPDQGKSLGLDVGENGRESSGVRGKASASCGESEGTLAASPGPVKQDEPGLPLQRRHVLGHPRRREVQSSAGCDDATGIVNCAEHEEPVRGQLDAAGL